jgi:hypothetical protein
LARRCGNGRLRCGWHSLSKPGGLVGGEGHPTAIVVNQVNAIARDAITFIPRRAGRPGAD